MRLSVDSLGSLFESLDPAPHAERDLDPHAEQFLVAWAGELPKHLPLKLTIHIAQWPPESAVEALIGSAVRHHFEEMARLTRMDFHSLMRQGRISLAIGLSFLLACVLGGNAMVGLLPGDAWPRLVRETLSIGGSVAMWRPLQIYLYDWWPLKSREALYRRMAQMQVQLLPAASPRAAAG